MLLVPVAIFGHFLDSIPSPSCILGKIRNIPSGELPTLYSGVEWALTERKEVGFFPLTLKEGKFIYVDGYYIKSVGLETYPSDFIDYYKIELGKRCWVKIDRFDGPGSLSYEYATRGGHYIWFGVLNPPIPHSLGWSEYPNHYQVFVKHD